MVKVKFFAQDKKTKETTNSSVTFFDQIDEETLKLISLNRDIIQRAMPTARVLVVIEQLEEQYGNFFV